MSVVDYFCLSVFGYFCFCQITAALLYPSTRPKPLVGTTPVVPTDDTTKGEVA